MKRTAKYLGQIILTAIFGLFVSATDISAATFFVTNTNDTGEGSLRQAIAGANAVGTADTIVFDASFNVLRTITLATGIEISPNASADTLTITGPGANLLTIRSSGDFINVGIFQNGANNGPPDTTSISGITFGQGTAPNPGRSILSFGNLNISNCVFTGNRASDFNQPGASIQHVNSNTALTVNNSVFTGNTTNGATSNGGAISNSGTATITNSTFSGNSSGGGGAIGNFGALSVTGCTFTNNTAGFGGGGGILSESGVTPISATITNSTFTGNVSNGGGGGGGIRNSGGTMNISGLTFTNNTSVSGGGGITTFNATTNISSSIFTGNKATGAFSSAGEGNGGAISSVGGSSQTTITSSIVSRNEATSSGGGIHFGSSGRPMSVTNSTISHNFGNVDGGSSGLGTGGAGGGVFIGDQLEVTISSSTIVDNQVRGGSIFGDGNGGGLCIGSEGTLMLRNSIVANNFSTATGQDIAGPVTSQGYNLIERTPGAVIGGTTTGNITGVDPLLGPLSFNGGPTRTFSLRPDSPAIDTGDPATFPPTDQRASPVRRTAARESSAPTSARTSAGGTWIVFTALGMTSAAMVERTSPYFARQKATGI